mgnify:CR=1 FL=1
MRHPALETDDTEYSKEQYYSTKLRCNMSRYERRIDKDESFTKIVIGTMLELPEYCYDCPCHDGEHDKCKADAEGRTSIYRPFWCPLREEKDRVAVYRGD